MSRLSDSQLIVLTAACQRPDLCVFPITAKLKGNAAGNVLKSLLKKDLIKEVRTKSSDDTVWRHDEKRGRMTLVATKAAFAALGMDPRDEAEDAQADTKDEAPAEAEDAPEDTQNQGTERTPRPRWQQAGATHFNATSSQGRHDRRDRRGAVLAAAHRARRHGRSAEEEAWAGCLVGKRRQARAHLSNYGLSGIRSQTCEVYQLAEQPRRLS